MAQRNSLTHTPKVKNQQHSAAETQRESILYREQREKKKSEKW